MVVQHLMSGIEKTLFPNLESNTHKSQIQQS